jgi:hypothetical protein
VYGDYGNQLTLPIHGYAGGPLVGPWRFNHTEQASRRMLRLAGSFARTDTRVYSRPTGPDSQKMVNVVCVQSYLSIWLYHVFTYHNLLLSFNEYTVATLRSRSMRHKTKQNKTKWAPMVVSKKNYLFVLIITFFKNYWTHWIFLIILPSKWSCTGFITVCGSLINSLSRYLIRDSKK